MKIAIIYTGAIRTMEKTILSFKQNVLLDDNRHVFAVLQSDNKKQDELILNQISDHIKSLVWFNKNDEAWLYIKTNLLNKMTISDSWKYYLGYNSGSMIEYYQMYLAYLQLEEYEIKNNFKYDYILRIRTDCVLTKPFIIKNYHDDDIIKIFNLIKDVHQTNDIAKIVTIFMTSMLDDNRCNVTSDITHKYYIKNNHYQFMSHFINYLNQGDYLITFRDNVIYYGPRQVFDKIYQLGITYGQLREYDDGYWFNAEGQLKSICLHHHIDIFDSWTTLECQSLYNYQHDNYYHDNKLKQKDDLLFFLQRS